MWWFHLSGNRHACLRQQVKKLKVSFNILLLWLMMTRREDTLWYFLFPFVLIQVAPLGSTYFLLLVCTPCRHYYFGFCCLRLWFHLMWATSWLSHFFLYQFHAAVDDVNKIRFAAMDKWLMENDSRLPIEWNLSFDSGVNCQIELPHISARSVYFSWVCWQLRQESLHDGTTRVLNWKVIKLHRLAI